MRLFFDVECYKNYFLLVLTNEEGKSKRFEIFNDDASEFDAPRLRSILSHKDTELVSFNGLHYDMPMVTMAIAGYNTQYMKKISDEIITKNMKSWQAYQKVGLDEPDFNHIDLIELAIGIVSLKIYGGRMHSKKLQDLPIDPNDIIVTQQLPLMREYCKNDTLVTRDLYQRLEKQVELRREMSKQYGVDLRSKSDAQIAEAVLKAEFYRLTGKEPPKTEITYKKFNYEPPSYIRFRTPELREVLETICTADMIIGDSGHVEMPKEISKMKIKIGSTTYKIGIGGLHSQESEVAHHTDDDHVLIDRDVASYYPNLMLNMGMSPGSFGDHFQTIYRDILNKRMASKRRAAELEKEIAELEKELEALDEQDVSP